MIERLWRSKTLAQKPNTKYDQSQNIDPNHIQAANNQLHLPNSIGCKIIEMEMQIEEGNLTKDMLIALLQQYTKAVEFYEEKNDQRYKLYQKKMANFLQREAVDAVLKGRQNEGSMIIKKQRAQQQIRKATNQSKNQAKQLLQTSQVGALKQKNEIQKQVNKQMQSLSKRLDKRSNSQHRKSKNNNKKIGVDFIVEDPKLQLLTEFKQNPKVPRPKKTMINRM